MNNNTKKIYIAGPLGFSEAGREFLYSRIIPLIETAGFSVLDPWKLTDQELILSAEKLPPGVEKIERWQIVNHEIGRNNVSAIQACDGIVAVLDGTDVDSGTAAEIGYGSALKKIIIGYRSDFRLCGDNEGALINLQVEYFIHASGGRIVNTLELIKSELLRLF
jgi:nucleoside 2-deoxyribosyltransferase